MSDLLNKPSNVVYRLQLIKHMNYSVETDDLGTIGTLTCNGPESWHYKNDRVEGTKQTVGEAVRALYYSKLG